MDGTRTHFPVPETRAHAQVLSEEVRAYLLHHGGALDVHDEAALDTFAERFLLPTMGAAWTSGRRATLTSTSSSNGGDKPGDAADDCEPINPYTPTGRGRNRGAWWYRLLRHRPT